MSIVVLSIVVLCLKGSERNRLYKPTKECFNISTCKSPRMLDIIFLGLLLFKRNVEKKRNKESNTKRKYENGSVGMNEIL